MSSQPSASDPYTAKAADEPAPSQKIEDLKKITAGAKFAMLTTRSPNGLLHSRAMSPADSAGLVFSFIANKESGKFDDLENDPSVNISWSDANTNWASAAGKATVITDAEKIKPIFNPMVKAWFDDKKDGVHTGDYNDPRVACIQVVPDEIRYWYRTSTSVGQLLDVAKNAIGADVSAPGRLVTINASDLQLARSMDDKKV